MGLYNILIYGYLVCPGLHLPISTAFRIILINSPFRELGKIEQISEIIFFYSPHSPYNVEMKPREGSEIRELSTPENGEGLRQSYHWDLRS